MEFHLYPWIKFLHISCALLSIGGFIARGLLKLLRPDALARQRWLRIAPHIIDTILLLCGIYLALQLQQYPGTTSWLTAKVIALVVYILLGMMVMRLAATQPQRILAFAAALLTFAYIIAVAITRNPWVL